MKILKNISSSIRMRPLGVMLLLVGALTGCTASSQSPQITQPVVQPMNYREPAPQYANPGSIYSGNSYRSLYEDGRARRVGDIVTIQVIEESSASQTVDTTNSRDSSLNGGITSLLGFNSIFNKIPIADAKIAMESKNSFTGAGETTRDNSVSASLAARVINVLADGNMEIEAVREIKVNSETQFMVVTGIIHTRDISTGNTITSTKIANAKIEYYGQGVLTAKQKPGWLIRLIDAVSPF